MSQHGRQTLLALAGATAGLAATVLAPTAAQAAPLPETQPAALPRPVYASGAPRPVYASGVPRPVYASGWSPEEIRQAFGSLAQLNTPTCRATGDIYPNNPTDQVIPTIHQGGASNPDNTACSLARGNVELPVFKVQDMLNRCYGQKIAVDGNFGDDAYHALRAMQRAEKIDDDGQYGPQTLIHAQWPVYRSGVFDGCSRPSIQF